MLVLPQVGDSLLHEAAWGNCSSVIGELVKAGLDVNIVNKVSSILCDDCTKTRYLNSIEACDTTYIEDTFFCDTPVRPLKIVYGLFSRCLYTITTTL